MTQTAFLIRARCLFDKELKNIINKFRNAIKCGTGEAHILLSTNLAIDFSKEIIKAALFNYVYDQQSEGNRGIYLAELIDLCEKKNKILKTIYKTLEVGEKDSTLEQAASIATIFAKRGDENAKKAVYSNFYRNTIEDASWSGARNIVEINGLDRLKYVVETIGRSLLKNADAWEDSWFVDNFQKENPSIDVYAELRKASEISRYTKKYLEEIEARKFLRKESNRPTYNYGYFKEKIDNDKTAYVSTGAVQRLSGSDLKRLADDFLKETDRIKQQKYLMVFCRVKFPYDYQPILRLAKAKNRKKDKLVRFAARSLQFFTENDIRQFALKILSETKNPDDYIDLLIGNYQTGDWALLQSIAKKQRNDDVVHSLGSSYIDIYRANPTTECKKPLEVIYRKMNCGLHRYDLVQLLIDNNVLSDKIRSEIQFDSNEETRKLYSQTVS